MCKSITRLFLCAGLFAGHVFTAQNSFAQVWPAVTWEWSDAFIDNKYVIAKGQLYGDGPRSYGGPKETCAVEPCGWPSYGNYESNTCSTYLDGQLYPYCNNGEAYFPDRMAEGVHNAVINFLGCIGTFCWSSPDSPKVPYTFPLTFYVDNSPSTQTIITPAYDSVVLPAEALFKGRVKDPGVGIRDILAKFSVNGGCNFKEDVGYSPIQRWCSSEYYADYPESCNFNIGISRDFTAEYNIFKHLDIPPNTNCVVSVELASHDRLDNVANPPEQAAYRIDNAPPIVTITTPDNMSRLDRENPVIAGEVRDYIGVVKMWLTIQDDRSGAYWNRGNWQIGPAVIAISVPKLLPETGLEEKSGNWQYTGLTKEALRSGQFTITAYAQDKGGLIGTTQLSTEYIKRDDLGQKEFTGHIISMKEVKNIARPKDTNSFTTIAGEEVIGITAQITPLRLSGILNSYVKWNVLGATDVSGKPTQPKGGNPSVLFLTIPPIPARPEGRSERMGYTVFPRVEIEGTVYYSPDHMGIYQDKKDELRQQYVDMLYDRFPLPIRTELQLTGPAEFADPEAPAYWNAGIEGVVASLKVATGYNFTIVSNGGSGFRSPIHNEKHAEAEPKKSSRHSYGRAADCHFKSKNNDGFYEDDWEVIEIILKNTAGIWYLPERVIDSPTFDNGWFHLEIPAK